MGEDGSVAVALFAAVCVAMFLHAEYEQGTANGGLREKVRGFVIGVL